MAIPKLSNPLAKSIRTGEGILVYATNVALAVAAALPHGLTWTQTGTYLTILNGVHVISRTLLKVSAVASTYVGGDPIVPNPVSTADVAAVTSDVAQAVTDITDYRP